MTSKKPAEQPLPSTREELLALHREARHRRHSAAPGSRAWEQASADVGRIEVQIARVERAMTPPKM